MPVAVRESAEEFKTLLDMHREFKSAVAKSLQSQRQLEAETRKGTDAYKAASKAHAANISAMKKLAVEKAKLAKAERKLRADAESAAEGMGGFLDKVLKAGNAIKGAISSVGRLSASYGIFNLSISNLSKTMVNYNKSMFSISRSQQMFGRGMEDMNSALKRVSQNTVMSQQDFLDFSNSIAKTYKGIIPTNMEMVKLAENMQARLGPNIDLIKEKLKDLMAIQNEFPSMYEDIMRAQDMLAENDIKGAEKAQASILMRAAAYGMSNQQIQTMAEMTTKATESQKKQVDYNKEVANTQKEAADAMLEMAKTAEPMLKNIEKLMGKLYKVMASMPGLIVGIGAAWTALNIGKSIWNAVSAAKGLGGAFRAISLAKMGGTLAKMGPAAGIVGAAIGGWALGKALDKTLGISDAIAKIATQPLGKTVDEYTISLSEAKGHAANLYKWMSGTTQKQMDEKRQKKVNKELEKQLKTNKEFAKAWGQFSHNLDDSYKTQAEMTKLQSMLARGSQEEVDAWVQKGVERDKAAKAAKEEVRQRNFLVSIGSKEVMTTAQLVAEYSKAKAELKAQLKLHQTILSNLQKQIDISIKFGIINKDALEGAVTNIEQQQEEIKEMAANIEDTMLAGLEKTSFKVDIDANLEPIEKLRSAQEQVNRLIADANVMRLEQETILAKASKQYHSLGEGEKHLVRLTRELNKLKAKGSGANEEDIAQAQRKVYIWDTVIKRHKEKLKGVYDIRIAELEGINEKTEAEERELKIQKKLRDMVGMSAAERKKALGEIAASVDDIGVLQGVQAAVAEQLAKWDQSRLDKQNKIVKTAQAEFETRRDQNSEIAAMLDAERAYVETAMVGFGASVEMLQKQVELKQKMVENNNAMIESLEKQLFQGKELSESDKERLLSARSKEEREKIAADIASQEGAPAQEDLVRFAREYNKAQTDNHKLNKEIMDMTKSMRDGYLDVIREMSTGLGEFEKIIGTQEMGASQLMNVIEDVGEGISGNTARLGGQVQMIEQGAVGYAAQQEALQGMQDTRAGFTQGGLQLGRTTGQMEAITTSGIGIFPDLSDVDPSRVAATPTDVQAGAFRKAALDAAGEVVSESTGTGAAPPSELMHPAVGDVPTLEKLRTSEERAGDLPRVKPQELPRAPGLPQGTGGSEERIRTLEEQIRNLEKIRNLQAKSIETQTLRMQNLGILGGTAPSLEPMGEGGAGQGRVEVVVNLSDDLTGRLQRVEDAIVRMEQGAATA